MTLFNKLCLLVGKLTVFLLTFLSFFYMTDLVCTSVKPYINEFLAWVVVNYQLTIVSSFTLILFIATILYVLTRISLRKTNKSVVTENLEESNSECVEASM